MRIHQLVQFCQYTTSCDTQRRLTGYDLYQDNSEDPVSEVWYSYDALGNMTEKSDLGGYELEYGIDPDGLWLHPHATGRDFASWRRYYLGVIRVGILNGIFYNENRVK